MNLRIRLVTGQLILVEKVTSWLPDELGVMIIDNTHKKSWFNKQVIASISEE